LLSVQDMRELKSAHPYTQNLLQSSLGFVREETTDNQV